MSSIYTRRFCHDFRIAQACVGERVYDVVVVGAGIMGSLTALNLVSCEKKKEKSLQVLLLEQVHKHINCTCVDIDHVGAQAFYRVVEYY